MKNLHNIMIMIPENMTLYQFQNLIDGALRNSNFCLVKENWNPSLGYEEAVKFPARHFNFDFLASEAGYGKQMLLELKKLHND